MVSLATQTDRTLFFDFLPIDLGIYLRVLDPLPAVHGPGPGLLQRDAAPRAPGRRRRRCSWATARRGSWTRNIESLQNLQSNLLEMGVDIRTLPVVMQYNKAGPAARAHSPDRGSGRRAQFPRHPSFGADALHGRGVFETLKGISELVLRSSPPGAPCDRGPQRQVLVRDVRRRRGQPAWRSRPAAPVAENPGPRTTRCSSTADQGSARRIC